MLTYENLIDNAKAFIPEFRTRYDEQIQADLIDKASGVHTVFSVVFVPLLQDSIKRFNAHNARLFRKNRWCSGPLGR